MQFKVAIDALPELLVVTGSGHASLDDLCRYMDVVAAGAAEHGLPRALLDLSGIDINFSASDHEALGVHTARALRKLERAASIVPVRYRVGTSERAAQQAGLLFRTFTNLVDAMQWLQRE